MRLHTLSLHGAALALLLATACSSDTGQADTVIQDTVDTRDARDVPEVETRDTEPSDSDPSETSPGDTLTDTEVGPNDTDTTTPLTTAPRAPSFTEAMISDLEVLGPKLVDGGVSFTVYSENATRLEVLIFDDPEVETPKLRVPMTRFGDVWSAFVSGLGAQTHYGYIAWGPNWPYDPAFTPGSDVGFIADVDAQGNRFNPNKLLIDPYAKALHRDHDMQKGIPATGHGRKRSTWAAAAKSVVIESQYQWSANEAAWRERRKNASAPGNGWHEHVAYEVHVKGFTRIPSSGVSSGALGTFKGFAEKADYLVDLGVTAVELMPINEKPLPNDGGYWGYQPLNYFFPENTYASDRSPTGVVDEFKYMVDVLHQKGLEVWVDVVFNHTGEGGLWTERPAGFEAEDTVSLYSFRGLDNAAYYALTPDGKGYWPNTGVGNMLRTNHLPTRKLIIDSLRYMVEELGVDGFRFDLAPVLGAKDGDYDRWDETANNILQVITDDPVLREHNTRLIAEPWAVGGDYAFKLGGFPAATDAPGVGWYEWNAHFRDWWRSFMNEDNHKLNTRVGPADGGYVMTGSYGTFAHNGRRPYHAMNFVTVHDGMTLYDLFSYDQKQNGCSPVNTICCTEPSSVWCQPDSGDNHNRSRNWGDEEVKRQLMRNLYVAMMISHGTPLLYAGDEWMRTQFGNNNAWTDSADNSASWLQWGVWRNDPTRVRMHDFVRKVIAYRKRHLAHFAATEYTASPWAWRNAANTGDPDWGSRHLAIHHQKDGQPFILVLINMEPNQVEFALPSGTWGRVLDTQKWFDGDTFFQQSGAPTDASANIDLDLETTVTNSYGVVPSSIVILERAP